MKKHKKINNHSWGFSLIELSLTLVIFSSIAVLTLTRMTTERDEVNKEQAMADLKTIKAAIEYFVRTNGYYPCPAGLSIVETDPDFGMGPRDTDGNCFNDSLYIGHNFDDDHARLDDFGLPPFINADEDDLFQGAVPCKDIGLPQNCAFDPYGNRYEYVVTAPLTRGGNSANNVPSACNYVAVGATNTVEQYLHLKVLKKYDGTTDSATMADDEDNLYSYYPDFVLIYFGKNAVGAYTKSGVQIESTAGPTSGYIDDSNYQRINHGYGTIGVDTNAGVDEIYYMPENPVNPADSKVGIDDILLFGKDVTLREKICVFCGDFGYGTDFYLSIACDGYDCDGDDFTDTQTAVDASGLCN